MSRIVRDPSLVVPLVPTTALPCRAVTLAVGVTAALAIAPAIAITPALVRAPGPASADPGADSTERRITAAEEQLEVVIEQFNGIREELRASQRRTDELGAETARLEGVLQARQAQVALLAATAYRTSNLRSLASVEAFLGAAAEEDLVQPLIVLDRLAGEQRTAIAELTATRTRLSDTQHALTALTATQRARHRQLSARKRQIENEIARLDRMRDASGDTHADRQAPRLPVLPPGAAATVVKFTHAQLGKPYQWAGSGPQGYDCSGLTSAAWAAAGVRLPHNAAAQWSVVRRISRAERRPGDLVFYYPDIHHVAVYVGEGKIIHAPRTGKPVRVDDVDYQPIHGYGRPG